MEEVMASFSATLSGDAGAQLEMYRERIVVHQAITPFMQEKKAEMQRALKSA